MHQQSFVIYVMLIASTASSRHLHQVQVRCVLREDDNPRCHFQI